jgi:L-alanine-DL-glutamate epimerase-like enolase superfamily enzyme
MAWRGTTMRIAEIDWFALAPVVTGGIRIADGRAVLPDAPGLGVDADWAELERWKRPAGA